MTMLQRALQLMLFSTVALRIVAINVLVDPSLASPPVNTYNTLAQAITALLGSQNQITGSNTITLQPSCLSVTQYLPNQMVLGVPDGNSALSISYANTSTSFTDSSVCSQLPTLALTATSYFQFANFSNVSISGLNIQFSGSPATNWFQQDTAVYFSQFCFNNSETSATLASGYSNEFVILGISQFTMTNGIYLFDGLKAIVIYKTAQVTIQQVTFVPLSWMCDTFIGAFMIISDSSVNSNLTVSNFQMICNSLSTPITMPNVISVSNLTNTGISSFSAQNCNFTQSSSSQQSIIMVANTSNLAIDNVTVSELTYGWYPKQYFISINAVANTVLSNFYITDSNFQYSYYTMPCSFVYYSDNGQTQVMSISLSGWSIFNIQVWNFFKFISVNITQFSNLAGVNLENFQVTNSVFYWDSPFIDIEVIDALNPLGNTMKTTPQYITFKSMTWSSNQISHENLIVVNYVPTADLIEANELLRLDVSNLTLINNIFYVTRFFIIDGIGIAVANLNAHNNTFITTSAFIMHPTRLGTILLSNGTVNNLSISDFSAFVLSNLTAARDFQIEAPYDSGQGAHVETRPYIVYNYSFTLVNITSQSDLLISTSPTTLIRNSSFSQILVNNSEIFNLGNYQIFLTSGSFYDQTDQLQPDGSWPGYAVSNFSLVAFPAAENSIFLKYPTLFSVYNSSRNKIISYDANNALFFICMQDNVIDTVQIVNSQALAIISNFEIPNGTIFAFNNTFNNISSTDGANVFDEDIVYRSFFFYNSFLSSNISGYAIMISSQELQNLSLGFNQMNQDQNLAFLSITGTTCNSILLQNNQFTNTGLSKMFTQVQCNQINGELTLQSSVHENITLISDPNFLEETKFINLEVTQTISGAPNSLILFGDNVFSKVTVTNQNGYSQGVYLSSFIFIVSAQCDGMFSNNTFDTIAAIPQGSIMSIALPTISFTDSSFSNLLFGSLNGAINLVSESLSVINCSFYNTKNFNPSYIGLFQLTNPNPSDVILFVEIQNSIFQDGVAAYSTIFSTHDTSIQLEITNSQFIDNQMTQSGSILYFSNISSSSIKMSVVNITQNTPATASGYILESTIYFSATGENVTLSMDTFNISVSGYSYGNLVSIDTSNVIIVKATNFTYSSGPSNQNQVAPMFGLMSGNNLQAYFANLQVIGVTLVDTPLFTINCITTNKINPQWNLTLYQSSFNNLNLTGPIIQLNSDANSKTSLDNFQLTIQNSTFSNVTWSGNFGGVIGSSTASMGRGIGATNFAINILSSSFTMLSGVNGLIYNGVESQFDFLIYLNNSCFVSIGASNSGAILNPSSTLLSSYQNNNSANSAITQDKASFKVTGNFFSNISALSGTLLFWKSQVRGISLFTQNNTFENISSSQDGGLIYTNYDISESAFVLSPSPPADDYLVIINSFNDSFNTISSRSGGVVYARGATRLLQQTFQNGSFANIQSSINGSIIYVMSSSSSSSASPSSKILQQLVGNWSGNISLIANTFQNISGQNGGVIYDATTNKSLMITAQSNIFDSISVSKRGGLGFLNDPIVSFHNNTFIIVTAQYAGNLLYSISDDIDVNSFETANNVVNQSTNSIPMISFAPTNLQIKFISLIDSSILQLKNDDSPPYNPTVPNLTSDSLSQYQIDLILVYRGQYGSQVIEDESQNHLITLNFIPLEDESNTRKYWINNCTNSTCSALLTATLTGEANDSILVNATYSSDSLDQFQQFYISLRSCIPGEINDTVDQQCVYCEKPTYSLHPTDKSCMDCPIGGVCEGGASISVIPGYWRNISFPDIIYQCNDLQARCLGGFNSTCKDGYKGPLCLQCDYDNSYATDKNSSGCSSCPNLLLLIIVRFLAWIFPFAYTIYVFKNQKAQNELILDENNQDEAFRKNLKQGLYIDLLITYSQVMTIIVTFPGGFGDLLSIAGGGGGGGSGQGNSLFFYPESCLLIGSSIKCPFCISVAIGVITPFLQWFLLCLYYLVFVYKFKLTWKRFRRFFLMGVTFYLLNYPTICDKLIKLLNCSNFGIIGGDMFVSVDPNTSCTSDEYVTFTNFIAIPALIIWSLGIPAIFVISIRCFIKHHLNAVRQIFGQLVIPYKVNKYYWAFGVIVLKLGLLLANNYAEEDSQIRALSMIIILYLYRWLEVYLEPYADPTVVVGVRLSLYAYIITIFFSLYYTDNTAFMKVICILVIVVMNTIGLGYILSFIVSNVYEKILPKLKALAPKIFSRGNKISPEIPNDEGPSKALELKTIEQNDDTSNRVDPSETQSGDPLYVKTEIDAKLTVQEVL